MSCFYFCFFLLIFVFKVLGSPLPLFRGRRASPARIDATSHTMRGVSGFQCTYKRNMADCTCMVKPAIALLYSHIYTPAIK